MASAIQAGLPRATTDADLRTTLPLNEMISGVTAVQIEALASKISRLIVMVTPKARPDLEISILQRLTLDIEFSRSIKDVITTSFSTPLSFLEKGIDFRIDSTLGVMVTPVAKEGLIAMLPERLPVKYTLEFKIDPLLSQQRKELVFSIKEKTDAIELSQDTFTLRQLQDAFFAD